MNQDSYTDENQFAFLVGINYTGQKSELRGCCNDAYKMREVLVNKFNVPEQNIQMLVDDDRGVFEPTASNILAGLKWLATKAILTRNSRVYWHYSGHGTQIRDYSGDERDGGDEAIVPSDADKVGLISDDVLKREFVSVLPGDCRLFCLMDACHSGSGLDLCYRFDDKLETTVYENYRAASCNAIMISGCRDDQTSADAYNRETSTNEGAMTSSFCSVFNEVGKVSNAVDFVDLMHAHLKKGGYTQKPQVSSSRPIVGVQLFT